MCTDLDDWLEHLAGVRRVSPETVRSYRVAVGAYVVFLEARGRRARRARAGDVEAYAAQLRGAPATVSQRLYAVKSFHRWLEQVGRAKINPARPLSVPPVPEQLAPPPSRAIVAQLLAAHDSTPRGVRDRAVASMLYGCGLRVCELRGIRLRDIDLESRRLHVRGKGQRRRNVPVPIGTTRDVARWLEVRSSDSLFLFPGRDREGKRGQEAIYDALKAAARRARVPSDRIHPHALRHAFAVHLLRSGVDVRRIQRLLGHSDISTTCIYLRVDVSDLADAVDAHHPLSSPTAAPATPWSNWLRAS